MSVSCFFVAGGSSEQTERNSTHSSHIIFAFGFGPRCNETFFFYLSFCWIVICFLSLLTRLIHLYDRSWQRKTIDFFRVFFVLYHQSMCCFEIIFAFVHLYMYVLYCVCRSWLWQWKHFRPAAETLFLCLYTVLASFLFFWISWISPPHLFICL